MPGYDLSTLRTAACSRCARLLQVGGPGSPDARLLKRTTKTDGYCANCSATQFLKTTPVLVEMMNLRGPEVLLNPMVQAQFSRIMQSGNADAMPTELDWQLVVKNWDLPVLGERKARKQAGLDL